MAPGHGSKHPVLLPWGSQASSVLVPHHTSRWEGMDVSHMLPDALRHTPMRHVLMDQAAR